MPLNYEEDRRWPYATRQEVGEQLEMSFTKGIFNAVGEVGWGDIWRYCRDWAHDITKRVKKDDVVACLEMLEREGEVQMSYDDRGHRRWKPRQPFADEP